MENLVRKKFFLGQKPLVQRRSNGKLIGYGGDFEIALDPSVADCAVRELGEESGFKANSEDMEVVACIQINDEKGPRLRLYYYFLRTWTGSAGISNEILNPQWYRTRPLPDGMLGADYLILPRVLAGEKLVGQVTYDSDMKVVDYKFTSVDLIK